MGTGTAAQAGSAVAHSEFEGALTPDTLSALMRSTWTWDDRALRRDLSALLVEVVAARGDIAEEAIGTALRARGLAVGARFVANVLGPHLVADIGSTHRRRIPLGSNRSGGFRPCRHQHPLRGSVACRWIPARDRGQA